MIKRYSVAAIIVNNKGEQSLYHAHMNRTSHTKEEMKIITTNHLMTKHHVNKVLSMTVLEIK